MYILHSKTSCVLTIHMCLKSILKQKDQNSSITKYHKYKKLLMKSTRVRRSYKYKELIHTPILSLKSGK
jgi:hypothetical protein